MNDWWNDPPEDPEAPECPKCLDGCGEVVNLTAADGSEGDAFQCDACGWRWPIPAADPDPEPEDYDPGVAAFCDAPCDAPTCPHGRAWVDCNDCMVAGDMAFDAARERGLR